MKVLVAGSGGFIGGHLVRRLLDEGHEVRAVDIKPAVEWWQDPPDDPWVRDLREECSDVCQHIDHVYNLACDMGGMGFIENNKAACMLSVLINTNLIRAARAAGVKRYFFSSSACVYAAGKQDRADLPALKESDAWPAEPEAGYGLEKLFSEELCRYAMEDWGLETRVARFHNVYGPHGSWNGVRTKAPAAICRKVAKAKLSGSRLISIWGDGTCTRSFMWIDDCIEGIRKIMDSDIRYPINLGSSQVVCVEQLVGIIEDIAGVKLERLYDTTQPQGVAGRNSDNRLIQIELSWEPTCPLGVGLRTLYEWIEQQVKEHNAKL